LIDQFAWGFPTMGDPHENACICYTRMFSFPQRSTT
jgi:hypothetical protein